MEVAQKPKFDHKDRRDIYEYVERSGATDTETVRETLQMDRRAFGHHVAILKRNQVLEEVDGKIRVAFDAGAQEEFETDDVSFTIRQAREEDLTGLVGAIREAIGGGEYVKAETVADVVDNEGVLIRHNEIESRMFFVATVDNEVVGWVHLKHTDLDKLSHTAELTVGVLEEYRGNGIGSHLLQRGLEWASKQGLEKIYNQIPATNEVAIEFLQSRGWEIEAVREAHYRMNGEDVDEVMLATKL
ncbi:N-acetyltransferase family protein [Halovenus marina]|uniref:GNAT family N-acetyltransferase n=1 Tax=Halovenus marina TaxID=3396621 RepID=UPI003F548928